MPAMIHVSSSCNPSFHAAGCALINADTSVFMQLIQGDLFKDFPTLKFVIPAWGWCGARPLGALRGMCLAMRKLTLADHLLDNVFFDTCVYHLPGIRLLTEVVPVNNILFASEMLGAVPDIDPDTGYAFDDTRRYLDDVQSLDALTRYKIFEGNARRIYPRLDALLTSRGHAANEMEGV
jgi:4-oxalmesaconate hydratase